MVPIVPVSVGSGSFRSQGFTFRSSGPAQLEVYLRRISVFAQRQVHRDVAAIRARNRDVRVTFWVGVVVICCRVCPVIRSMLLGQTSQAWFSIWIQTSIWDTTTSLC